MPTQSKFTDSLQQKLQTIRESQILATTANRQLSPTKQIFEVISTSHATYLSIFVLSVLLFLFDTILRRTEEDDPTTDYKMYHSIIWSIGSLLVAFVIVLIIYLLFIR